MRNISLKSVSKQRLLCLKLTLIFGTRPQIIKCIPIIREFQLRNLEFILINTGQHYDFEMSKIFLQQMSVPEPDYDFEVGSGTHANQTAKIMMMTEETLKVVKPDLCIVPGDTNSALGSALGA